MTKSGSNHNSGWAQRLGQTLVANGHISDDQFALALVEAQATNSPFAAIVVRQGLTTPAAVLETTASLTKLPVADLYTEHPTGTAVRMVPGELACDLNAIGYREQGERLVMAFSEPPTPDDLKLLGVALEHEIVPVIADPVAISKILEVAYPEAAVAATGAPQASAAENGSTPPVVAGPDSAAAEAQPTSVPAGVGPPGATASAPGLDPPRPPGVGPSTGGAVPPVAQANAGGGAPSWSLDDLDDASLAGGLGGQSSVTTAESGSIPPYESLVNGTGGAGPVLADEGGSSEARPDAAVGQLAADDVMPTNIDDLLYHMVELGASDLHLSAGLPPSARVNGSIRRMEGYPPLENHVIREMIFGILTQSLRERFEANKELDTSHSLPGIGRFRVNVMFQRTSVGAVLRAIPHSVPPFKSLGLPKVVRSFAEIQRGLVLVTGPTGSGKSTTLASLVDIINKSKPLHIVTIEDPIEFLHNHQHSIVNQREVGQDTHSFADALKHVLRQDPDVILVGEMRDLETIATALTAAETGHLVFATLHTQDAPQTIDRIIDVFPTNQQSQIRVQLSTTLEAVLTQQLLQTADGTRRVVVPEIMVATPAVRNLIREAKTHQIPSVMQAGGKFGMQTMDQSLSDLVKAGTITEAVAFNHCHSEDELRRYLNG
jgi:twitching motility protein PilT